MRGRESILACGLVVDKCVYWRKQKESVLQLKAQKQLKLPRSVRIEPTTAPFVEMAVSSASMYF
jgi:hypothetical protein